LTFRRHLTSSSELRKFGKAKHKDVTDCVVMKVNGTRQREGGGGARRAGIASSRIPKFWPVPRRHMG